MSINQVNNDGTVKRIAGGTLYADAPLGTILAFGGAEAPAGWILCQGQALSRTNYAKLFEVIGTAFGSGDGSTTFNIPDLRGEFLRGAGNNSHTQQGNGGAVGQHQDATLMTPAMAESNFNDIYALSGNKSFINSDIDRNMSLAGYSRVNTNISPGGIANAVTPRPTNTSVNFIIKVMMVSLPADIKSGVQEEMTNKVGFLDTTNIIQGNTDIALNDTYTATENCWIRVQLQNTSGAMAGVVYTINGINSVGHKSNSNFYVFLEMPIMKGQTVKFTEVTGTLAICNYLVFGMKH